MQKAIAALIASAVSLLSQFGIDAGVTPEIIQAAAAIIAPVAVYMVRNTS